MKIVAAMVLLMLPLACAHCAESPLQQIVDEHKQQRLQDAYANKPLAYGSSDGIGMYSAQSPHAPVTVAASR